jgi:hypothetical protein
MNFIHHRKAFFNSLSARTAYGISRASRRWIYAHAAFRRDGKGVVDELVLWQEEFEQKAVKVR